MSTKGKVSVLISLYNRTEYIKETIESALTQEYKNIEIIIVDDGSTDGGDSLVESIISDDIRLLRHPNAANKGQAASLNLALAHATGEYIAFLDSDDLFLPGKLLAQVDFLEKNSSVGLVYGMGYAIDSSGEIIYNILSDEHQETNDPNTILLDCYFHLPAGSLVRKTVLDQAGSFDESLRAGADHDMQVRLAEITRFGFLPNRVYCYRRHHNSLSMSGSETMWRSGFTILDKAAMRHNYKTATLRKRRAVINFRLGTTLLKNKKDYIEGFFRLTLAGLLDPIRSLNVILGKE